MIPEDQKGEDKPNTDPRTHGHTEAQTPNQNTGMANSRQAGSTKKMCPSMLYVKSH